ncbi:MAG: transcriptional regulator [Flavobacteriales bacterium]|nr:transcriptional regulator [Flavobacteriales bacterium]
MENKLNPLIHQELRLAILTLLVSVKSADFTYIKEQTKATQGNLSIQIKKLQEAKYIKVTKTFVGNYPKTYCEVTELGKKSLEEYIKQIKLYLNI